MRYARHRARLRLAVHARSADAGEHLQVPPAAARSTRSTRCGSTASSRDRSRPPGGCSAATRGAAAGWTTHDRLLPRRDSADRAAREPDVLGADPHPRRDRVVVVVDRRADDHRPDPARAADGAADPLDAEPAGARARDEGAAAEVQERPEAAERGADEVLPGEQHQPGRVMPPARGADPGLHLPLLRAEGLREGDPAAARRRRPAVARPRRHHRGHEDRLGAVAPRRLRPQPADLVVPDVGADAESAARAPDGAADRLHPVHPQLPLRPDDLLADDQPLDDRAGSRHAPADAEARRTPEKRSSRTPAKAESKAEPPPVEDGNGKPAGQRGQPRRVRRKKGGSRR